MAGIGIISNPHSKANKRDPKATQLLAYIVGQHGQMAVTQSLSELSTVARKFQTQEIDILAINGGDGTVTQTLSVFRDVYQNQPLPRIMILRGGTMNVLAQNLGIFEDSATILGRLVERYATGQALDTVEVPSLDVDGRIGFLFADGAAVRMLDTFYQNKTGPLGAALMIARIGFSALMGGSFAKFVLQSEARIISCHSRTHHFASLGVFISTLPCMPFRVRMFPHLPSFRRPIPPEKTESPRLEMVVVTTPFEKLLWGLFGIVFSRTLGQSTHKWVAVDSLCTIQNPDSPGYSYSLDGEIFDATSNEIEVKIGPPIRFVSGHRF